MTEQKIDRFRVEEVRNLLADSINISNPKVISFFDSLAEKETTRKRVRVIPSDMQERDQKVIDAYLQGKMPKDIFEMYGVSDGCLGRILKNHNIPRTNLRNKSPDITKEYFEKEYFEKGLSIGKIAKNLGVGKTYALRKFNAHGFTALGRRVQSKPPVETGPLLVQTLPKEIMSKSDPVPKEKSKNRLDILKSLSSEIDIEQKNFGEELDQLAESFSVEDDIDFAALEEIKD